MAGFLFIVFVLVAALMVGFKAGRPSQLPSMGLVVAFTLAAGAYLFV
jgi:hypothetical protein